MLIQVYKPELTHLIEKHDFFVSESKKRVIGQFADIEGEADKYADEWLESSHQFFDPENDDPGSFYERANEKAMEHYFLLSDMKKHAILAMTASIFHHWDKSFRAWLVKELRFNTDKKTANQIWDAPLPAIAAFFKYHGWDMANEPAMQKIMVLKDVVDAYKHGEGRAFKRLEKQHPEYLDDFINEMSARHERMLKPSYENLCVREPQFDDFARCIRDFWQVIPTELYWRDDD